MSENTKLWDMLGRTDPAHTKGFTRGGGFKGTAIKPMWSYRRMTEEFGPCGMGWGIGAPTFRVEDCGEERLVFCTVTVWYEKPEQVLVGVGGDKVVAKNKYGISTDDEAYKKSFTDAVTNALKLIGVGADVHMGLFDDSKYVRSMKEEFSEPANDKPKKVVGFHADGTRTAHSLKKEGVWDEMQREMAECKTVIQIDKLRWEWSAKAATDKWPKHWCELAAEEFDKAKARLSQSPEDDDVFPGDLPEGARNLMAG